jgi:hypothetical protein
MIELKIGRQNAVLIPNTFVYFPPTGEISANLVALIPVRQCLPGTTVAAAPSQNGKVSDLRLVGRCLYAFWGVSDPQS